MNEDFQEKLLEEMNRRSRNSAEREKRRRQVMRNRFILAFTCTLVILGAIVLGIFIIRKDSEAGTSEKTSQITSGDKGAAGNADGSGNAALVEGNSSGDNVNGIAGDGASGNTFGDVADGNNSGAASDNISGSQDASGTASAGDAEQAAEEDFEIKMTFVGDCCMGSNLENRSQGSMLWCVENYPTSYFFEKVKPYFENDDLTVANCECCISDREVGPRDKGPDSFYWFKAPKKIAAAFPESSIEAVSLCNNHAYDYGDECLADTQDAFDELGVLWGIREHILYYEQNGFTIAIVCVAFYSYDEVGVYCMPYLEEAKKNSDYQIVFFHGGTEGVHQPNDWKVAGCHDMIDAGADLIIGSHPHVLQGKETYNGVDIIYSLGNFCFGGNDYPENRTLIYKYNLQIHRSGDQFEVTGSNDEMIPCYVFTGYTNNWQPAPIEDEDTADRVIRFMNGELDSPL